MRKLLFLIMLLVALPLVAGNDVTDSSFPKNGYKIKWIKRTDYGFNNFSCTIKKFEDSDSIYYIRYETPVLQPYCVLFCFINKKGAEVIAHAMESLNRKERIKWIKGYLEHSNVYELDHINRYNKYWTYFKPKINERGLSTHFNLSAAIYAYNRDREKDKKMASITPEQWLQLYQAAKVVLPMLGGEEDNRTLYDKIMQDGGY